MTAAELPQAGSWPDLLESADDPTIGDYAGGHVFADEKGKLDGLLMRSGVRWVKLRWMHRAVRVRLFREVLASRMPENTRACWEGGAVWLDEARDRIDAQQWQQRRKDTWFSVGVLLAESVRPGMRPLTEISHEAIARAINKSDRYVTDIMRWYCDQGLLGKLLGGTRFPRMEIPEDETPQERADRLARAEAAETARQEQRRHARAQVQAQLDAAREGRPAPPTELEPYRGFRAAQHGEDEAADMEKLASVYELRLPIPPAPPPASPPAGSGTVVSLDEERRRRRSGPVDGCPQCHPDNPSNVGLTSSDPQNFYPNAPLKINYVSPEHRGPVENRRASRASHHKKSPRGGSKQQVTRWSVAQRAAEALLVGPVDGWCDEDVTLPDKLRGGVARSWLAAQVQPLTSCGWTPLELAWHLITGGGKYHTLPERIPNPRGWIRASLRAAIPQVRPAVKWAADELERQGQAVAAAMAEQIARNEAARRRELVERERGRGRALRAAIEACELCDEFGWLPVADDSVQAVRCSHDPDTDGW